MEKNLGCLGYIGGLNPTQLCGDFNQKHEIRIPVNQPGFHWKSGRVLSTPYINPIYPLYTEYFLGYILGLPPTQ